MVRLSRLRFSHKSSRRRLVWFSVAAIESLEPRCLLSAVNILPLVGEDGEVLLACDDTSVDQAEGLSDKAGQDDAPVDEEASFGEDVPEDAFGIELVDEPLADPVFDDAGAEADWIPFYTLMTLFSVPGEAGPEFDGGFVDEEVTTVDDVPILWDKADVNDLPAPAGNWGDDGGIVIASDAASSGNPADDGVPVDGDAVKLWEGAEENITPAPEGNWGDDGGIVDAYAGGSLGTGANDEGLPVDGDAVILSDGAEENSTPAPEGDWGDDGGIVVGYGSAAEFHSEPLPFVRTLGTAAAPAASAVQTGVGTSSVSAGIVAEPDIATATIAPIAARSVQTVSSPRVGVRVLPRVAATEIVATADALPNAKPRQVSPVAAPPTLGTAALNALFEDFEVVI